VLLTPDVGRYFSIRSYVIAETYLNQHPLRDDIQVKPHLFTCINGFLTALSAILLDIIILFFKHNANIHSLTHSLTPWSRVLLEKLTDSQLVKKFPAFYVTRRFITAFTNGISYMKIRKREANWIGHILHRNCLLQRVTEGKIQEGIKVTGRQGRRRRKLLDDLKKRRGYSRLKEEALDRTMWRARFGRGFGPVVRQITK
jgi:hypothetical protein